MGRPDQAADELAVYLQNHWAAAAGGRDLALRVVGSHRDSDIVGSLRAVANGIIEDREELRELMEGLDIRPATLFPAAVRVAERLGRLKPNGHLIRRSPASDVIELEALQGAVASKRAGWAALLALAAHVPDLPEEDLHRLRERADEQLAELARVHQQLAVRRLVDDAVAAEGR